MKMARHFPATRRGMRDGLIASQRLLEQGGFIRSVAPGIYALLPLGWRVHETVCRIVFEEMEASGVQNVQLPILQPKELWEQTGRWERYMASKTMFVTTERHSQAQFGLAPTAEEVVTALAAAEVTSYRQLPLILHQIGPKFRDEIRPRFGLLRCREFSMSDAYSFDENEEGMRASFELMREIYTRIFTRSGLTDCLSVQADSGAIGGQGSAEFMACADAGEDVLLTCDTCDYGANAEKAQSRYSRPDYDTEQRPVRWEHTPGIMSVEQLEGFFPGLTAQQMVKTIIFTIDPSSAAPSEVAVCIRGDLEINETKLRNALGCAEVAPADAQVVREITGAEVGFAGPINLTKVSRILFDRSVEGMTNFLCGYNTTDHHALDANFGVEIPVPDQFYELYLAQEGQRCWACETGRLRQSRGIEVGHVFMLQQGYARALDATYIDRSGAEQVTWMGCYGIGTTRLLQAIVEQNNDEKGIMWPEAVAPYLAYVMPINVANEVQRALAESVYEALAISGVEAILDDRDCQAGEKFADADLIGCPWRITAGRAAANGAVELRNRITGETSELSLQAAVDFLVERARLARRPVLWRRL